MPVGASEMERTEDKCFFCGVETARTLEVAKSDCGAVTTGPRDLW